MTQHSFCRAVRQPDLPAPDGLVDAAGRPAGRRFDVYRNNVAAALRDALETGFPACQALLGQDNFARVARLFQRDNPPLSPILMLYGENFPDFLAALPDVAHMGYLPCVARLELARRHSYHSADRPPIALSRLADLAQNDLEDAQIALAPALRLVRSPWPILQIHRYALGLSLEKPRPCAEDVLVTRPGLDPQEHVLPPGGAAMLHALMRGLPLGVAVAAACDSLGQDFDPTETLTLLAAQGAIIDLTLAGETPCTD